MEQTESTELLSTEEARRRIENLLKDLFDLSGSTASDLTEEIFEILRSSAFAELELKK